MKGFYSVKKMKKIDKIFIIILGAIISFTLISSAQSRRDKRDQPEKLIDIASVKPGMPIQA